MKKSLKLITPFIVELHSTEQEINIPTVPETLHITCMPWGNIRTTQFATLYIDGKTVESKHLLSLEGRLALPPVFKISAKDYLQPGQSHKISISVTEPDGTQNPNHSSTKTLTINIQT